MEDVNDNLNDIEVPLNKKSSEIVIRMKAQLEGQEYAQIKMVDLDEASTLIAYI